MWCLRPKDLNLARKTYDFPQEMFRLSRRHVDNEGLAVAISLVDLFHCPVDVAGVRHAVNIGLDRVTVQRDRRQELLEALQSCSTTPSDQWRTQDFRLYIYPVGNLSHLLSCPSEVQFMSILCV